ncbi:MAG: hypothetical protein ACJA0S_000579 [Rickettsiales bacterium]|jgi:hypothetical protein
MKTIISITLLLLSLNSNAAQIISNKADYENGIFSISAKSKINASTQNVFKILIDYKNISRISSKIIESRIINKNQNIVKVKTVAKGCILFFCKKITNVQLVTSNINKNITSITVPEESDLKSGKMFWELTKKEGITQIEYVATIEPDFFVPPLVGAFFIKKSMLQEAEKFVINVEKLANEL